MNPNGRGNPPPEPDEAFSGIMLRYLYEDMPIADVAPASPEDNAPNAPAPQHPPVITQEQQPL
jgi:hypothetical protein